MQLTEKLSGDCGSRAGLLIQALDARDGEVNAAAEWHGAGASQICDLSQPPVSISGGATWSIRPEAMLARGSRVTGSGGASCASLHADQSGSQTIFVLPHGTTLSFADLTDVGPLSFL